MTARASVQEDFMRRGVLIALSPERGTFIQWTTPTVVTVPEGVMLDDDYRLPLTDALARALLDALARHYNATGDVVNLRRDYEAERARVDRFIETFTGGTP